MSLVTAKDRSSLVYASSLAIDVATMKLVPEADTIAQEVEVVLGRIGKQLLSAGLDMTDVVNVTCYLRDPSYFEEFSSAFNEALAPGPYPVNTVVFLGLAGNCRVQIEAIAARRG